MNIEIRALQERDLPEADRIFRLAFGTFLGLPDPLAFAGDADFVNTRFRAAPEAAIGAFQDGVLVGSNFAANWGSFGFFGPLTVRPDFWDKGVAKKLMKTTMELFAKWGTRHSALFTFPHSPKHLGLYQKFGFWPQHLTAVMGKPIEPSTTLQLFSKFSELSAPLRTASLAACRALTDALYPGLDMKGEILAIDQQKIGETVLIYDDSKLVGFAICHLGTGSEAGSGASYVKFAAARHDPDAEKYFERLLSACEVLAESRGLTQLVAGVNTARHGAYQMMIKRGFVTLMQGVAMQQGNESGFNRPDCFVIDDWR